MSTGIRDTLSIRWALRATLMGAMTSMVMATGGWALNCPPAHNNLEVGRPLPFLFTTPGGLYDWFVQVTQGAQNIAVQPMEAQGLTEIWITVTGVHPGLARPPAVPSPSSATRTRRWWSRSSMGGR